MTKKQKLELTRIGKDKRPQLEPRILSEDAGKSVQEIEGLEFPALENQSDE